MYTKTFYYDSNHALFLDNKGQWMTMNENEWQLMTINDNEWKWMTINDN